MSEGLFHNRQKDVAFESDVFEFKENNKFNYVLFSCTGTGFGTGDYLIKNDTLILNFTDHPKYEIINDIQFNKGVSDSLSVKLKIMDYEYGDLLPGVNCYFPEEKIGWVTDLNGTINVKTTRKEIKRTLWISFTGYNIKEFEIGPETNEITGNVRLGSPWFYDSSDQLKFKIVSSSKNKFKLDRFENTDITYKRMDQKDVSKMVENRTGKTYEYFKK